MFLFPPPPPSVQTANDLNGAAREERRSRRTTAGREDRSRSEVAPFDRVTQMRWVCGWWWWEGLPYVHVVGVDIVLCLPVSVGLRREADAAVVVCRKTRTRGGSQRVTSCSHQNQIHHFKKNFVLPEFHHFAGFSEAAPWTYRPGCCCIGFCSCCRDGWSCRSSSPGPPCTPGPPGHTHTQFGFIDDQ